MDRRFADWAEVLADEAGYEPCWWFVAFEWIDDDDEVRTVTAVVEAFGFLSALCEVQRLGGDLGGAVEAFPFDPDRLPEAAFRRRLLSAGETIEAGLEGMGMFWC